MHVYQCWYRGLNGYCCRSHNLSWMFIPELDQGDNSIYKHVSLDELRFDNAFAKHYESVIEQQLQKDRASPIYFLRELFFPRKKRRTVEGMLFLPSK